MRNRLKFKVPGFAYPGGKVRLRKWLVSMMPREGRTYVEPFAGRGNVFWLAACALKFERWWLNDMATAEFLRALGRVDLGSLPIRISYKEAGRIVKRLKDGEASDVEHVVSPFVVFSGGTTKRGRAGRECVQRINMISWRNNLLNAQRILRRRAPHISQASYEEILCCVERNDFVYLDPPYDRNRVSYAVDTVDHDNLLRLLKIARFPWLLSGYATPRYISVLGQPYASRVIRMSVTPVHGCKQPKRTECVWKGNY